MLTLAWGERCDTPCALLLGGFDGLHIGHRALLGEAKRTGLPVCITTILGGKSGTLFTEEERTHIFEQAGIDSVLEIVFTNDFKAISAEDFLALLFRKIQAKAIFCGEDFRFGCGALGTPELLKKLAPCPVTALSLLEKEGKKVSVSLIKRLLQAGDLPAVNALLGNYFIQGKVEHGRQVGRTYGFPTLNLSVPEEKLLPPDGVYAGFAETPKGRYKTIINIGARPTFGIKERKIESYLEGFSGDLYGATVRIGVTGFLRPIMRFSSPEMLKEQLEKDKRSLKNVL